MNQDIEILVKGTSQVIVDQMNAQNVRPHAMRVALGKKWPASVPAMEKFLQAESDYSYRTLLAAAKRLGIEVVLMKDGVALKPSVQFGEAVVAQDEAPAE